MGILEDEFRKYRWPPLVKSVTYITTYPGYRHEFFRTFKDLDEYFSQECGADWQTQEWAKFWLGQHMQTRNDDRREYLIEHKGLVPQVDKLRKPRSDHDKIVEYILELKKLNNKFPSARKLEASLKSSGIVVDHNTVWRILRKIKHQVSIE